MSAGLFQRIRQNSRYKKILTTGTINSLSGATKVNEIVILRVRIGIITRYIRIHVIPGNLNYIIISNYHIRLFKLQLNFYNFSVTQYNNYNDVNFRGKLPQQLNMNYAIELNNVTDGYNNNNVDFPCVISNDYVNQNSDYKSSLLRNNSANAKQVNSLVDKYSHIFAKSKFDVGTINLEPPKIILTSELPISCRPYRASQKDNLEIKKQLDAMLEAGIIKPSHSPYASPITLAFKKDDQARTRLCIDYRKINVLSLSDAEPIPRIDSLLDQLTHAKFFSTLDLASGYWHIKLDEKSSEKLAFTSNYGLFEFTRLPFGWKNSPAIFQRAIRRILL